MSYDMLIEIQRVFLVSNTSIGKQAFLGVLGPYMSIYCALYIVCTRGRPGALFLAASGGFRDRGYLKSNSKTNLKHLGV